MQQYLLKALNIAWDTIKKYLPVIKNNFPAIKEVLITLAAFLFIIWSLRNMSIKSQ